MPPVRLLLRLLLLGVFAALIVAVVWWLRGGPAIPESEALGAFVHERPSIPIVFTSRSNAASFDSAAPEADGFRFPGTIPWAAEQGRLRLLDTAGRVYELTWGRELPGGSIQDVMSPSISVDGKRILFAGRRAAPDAGRWRIFQVDVDGRNLKQLTGLEDDPGCILVPPLRFGPNGERMEDDARKRLDYDDVDPADDGKGGFFFASSRLPDLGSGHSRRATQIWYRPAGASKPHSLSANRNNDRWPFLASDHIVLFSLWSRNREVVSQDGTEIVPVASAGEKPLTRPTDQWVGARVFPDASQFGYSVKIPEPVWRQRPLFNGRIAFMTSAPGGGIRLAQAEWGRLRSAPSSLLNGSSLPNQVGGELLFGPDRDPDGKAWSAGCPSPCPPHDIVFSACVMGEPVQAWGIHIGSEDWPTRSRLLFDDPELVDSEPVAVYARAIEPAPHEPPRMSAPGSALTLASGREYRGPVGLLDNNMINRPLPDAFPGQTTDAGRSPVVPHPTDVRSIVFYAAHRDRFDDTDKPRVPGTWEKLLVAPLESGDILRSHLPADPAVPTVLAGLDASGRVSRTTGAADRSGRSGTFLAIAGDHYSGTRAGGYHFCIGCHAGHTFIKADITERTR